jgi:catechol 2,3-dioxygenase-like lactoylglutathione lyase family enzyme
MQTPTLALRRVLAGVVVDDLEAAKKWYESVLGRPADAAPMGGLLEWHLNDAAWLQVVDIKTVRNVQRDARWGGAGASSVSFVVERLDDELAMFAAEHIPLVSQYTTKGFARTATVRDPSGNYVTFVEEPRSRN